MSIRQQGCFKALFSRCGPELLFQTLLYALTLSHIHRPRDLVMRDWAAFDMLYGWRRNMDSLLLNWFAGVAFSASLDIAAEHWKKPINKSGSVLRSWRLYVFITRSALLRVLFLGSVDLAARDSDLMFCVRAMREYFLAVLQACNMWVLQRDSKVSLWRAVASSYSNYREFSLREWERYFNVIQ